MSGVAGRGNLCSGAIATGPKYVKDDWRTATRFLADELKSVTLEQWVKEVSMHEDNPRSALEIFFRSLKAMTINGYYFSSIGIHDELKYQGNTYVSEFAGCQHKDHRG